ncbi:MAG: hypothetical protein L6R42_003989 [Xanthoria sp. 1 TBL-2021]|nr:MAG: hypothetical protein L6R42_003989 [Xanthoria sp. 1 TBL-2021]
MTDGTTQCASALLFMRHAQPPKHPIFQHPCDQQKSESNLKQQVDSVQPSGDFSSDQSTVVEHLNEDVDTADLVAASFHASDIPAQVFQLTHQLLVMAPPTQVQERPYRVSKVALHYQLTQLLHRDPPATLKAMIVLAQRGQKPNLIRYTNLEISSRFEVLDKEWSLIWSQMGELWN